MAMTLVSTTTVPSGGAASIEFTNIPQTGKDLLVLVSARADFASTSPSLKMEFNNQTTTYEQRSLGYIGFVASFTGSSILWPANGTTTTSNTFNNLSAYISNYTSGASKSVSLDNVIENNSSSDYFMSINAASWSGTNAITSLKLFDKNFLQHSTASLYIIS